MGAFPHFTMRALGWCVTLFVLILALGVTLPGYLSLRNATKWPARLPESHFFTGGTQVKLSAGETRYQIYGKELTHPKGHIVCVHGLTQPAQISWGAIGEAAVEQNYQVLSYDLYGRGGSQGPYVPNTPELFTSQLAELLWTLNRTGVFQPQEPIHLVGLSMGGAIVSHFTQTYPDTVQTLVLMAPAGLGAPIPLITKLVEVPILGDFLMDYIAPMVYASRITSQLGRHTDESWQGNTPLDSFIDLVKRNTAFQFASHPGFAASLLSTLRHFPLNDMQEIFRALPHEQIDIHYLWGDKDTTCPLPTTELLNSVLPGATGHILRGASHDFVTARSKEVTDLIFQTILN